MRGGERVPGPRSNLDKPLEELTDEDIVQLTREDCRRYLKEKGMRRPSWNKSQAIQQVLSLKSLFESKPDEEKKSTKHKSAPPSETAQDSAAAHSSIPQEKRHGGFSSKEAAYIRGKRITERQGLSVDTQIPRSGNKPSQVIPDGGRYGLQELVHNGHGVTAQQSFGGLSTNFPCERPSRIEDRLPSQAFQTETGTILSYLGVCRSASYPQPTAQLTIFYSGMVNVYDDVPADKAQAIMLLAGGGNYLCPLPLPNGFSIPNAYQNTLYAPYSSNLANVAMPPLLHANSVPQMSGPPAVVSAVANGTHSELPKTRKASVQRFLKKRKDRGRLKAATYVPAKKPSFDMYINPHLNSIRNGEKSFHSRLYEQHQQYLNSKRSAQSSGSETSSPTRPPQTPRRSSSNDDQGTSKEQIEDSFNVGGEAEATSPSQYSPTKV